MVQNQYSLEQGKNRRGQKRIQEMFMISFEGYQERAKPMVRTWPEFYVRKGSGHGAPRPAEAVAASVWTAVDLCFQ